MGNCCCWNKDDDDEKLAAGKIEVKSPVAERGCTDILCCLLFVLYMVGMVVVAGIAFQQGAPKRLMYPTDSNGKICGVEILNKPYLHFFDLTKCVTKGDVSLTDPTQLARASFSCPTPKVCYDFVKYTS